MSIINGKFLVNKLYKKDKNKILYLILIIGLGFIIYNFCKENKVIKEGVENKDGTEDSIELLNTEIQTEKDKLISKEELGSDEKLKFSEFLTDERKGAIKQVVKKMKRLALRRITKSIDKPEGTEDLNEAGEIIKDLFDYKDKISRFSFDKGYLSFLDFYIQYKLIYKHLGLDIDSILDESMASGAMGRGKNMLASVRSGGGGGGGGGSDDDDDDGGILGGGSFFD